MSLMGFDAVGRLALGQVPNVASFVLSTITGTFTEAGFSAAFSIKETNALASYSIVASQAIFSSGFTAAATSYVESGKPALFASRMSSVAASYTVVGLPATFSGSGAALGTGSYVITANVAPLLVGLTGGVSGLSVSGRDAALSRDFVNWVSHPGPAGSWTADSAPSSTWTPSAIPSSTWTGS